MYKIIMSTDRKSCVIHTSTYTIKLKADSDVQLLVLINDILSDKNYKESA